MMRYLDYARHEHNAIRLYNGLLIGGREDQQAEHHKYDLLVALDQEALPNNYDSLEIDYDIIHHFIDDFSIPTNKKLFYEVLQTIEQYLIKGKNVRVCCVGGHGRTGLVLAMLVGRAGIKQPVEYVRREYCYKAVETEMQYEFVCNELGFNKLKNKEK